MVGEMSEQKVKGVSSAVRRGVGGLAGETLKRTGSAVRGATSAVSHAPGTDAVEGVGEKVEGVGEKVEGVGEKVEGVGEKVEGVEEQAHEAARSAVGAVERAGGGGATGRGGEERTVGEELREIVREAALEVLVPAARRATTEAAKYAIRRGPQLARDAIARKLADRLGPAIKEAGGPGSFAKGALSSISGARTGLLEKVGIGAEPEPPARPWRERRLPVEESIDVAVPLRTAYDRFTEFDEYAAFVSLGEIVDERPNERITWERADRVEGTAVITFHRLSDRLTRVMVTYDHQPKGMLEKTTSLLRSSRRALRADLVRFKAFVEMDEEGTEASEAEPEQQQAEGSREPGDTRSDEDEHAEEDAPSAPRRQPVRRRPSPRQQKAKRR
jgi:hypothetical protein